MWQMRGLDDGHVTITASHLIESRVDGIHVLPRSVPVLFGDEPWEFGLLEVETRLIDHLFDGLGIVLCVGPEVSVVLPSVPEDSF